jgi:four helix bundle protein
MVSNNKSKVLYERLFRYAKKSLDLIGKLPKTPHNNHYGFQLIKSSSSPGANYIEAIEASSTKDFIHRLKICRKESKESIHWLRLIVYANKNISRVKEESGQLISEARELIKIFSSSVVTSERGLKKTK